MDSHEEEEVITQLSIADDRFQRSETVKDSKVVVSTNSQLDLVPAAVPDLQKLGKAVESQSSKEQTDDDAVSSVLALPIVGPIEHVPSNLCWHPLGGNENPAPGTKIVLHNGCYGMKRLAYSMNSEGVIMHSAMKVCVRPNKDQNVRNSELILSDKCDDEVAKFDFTESGDIVHRSSGLCVHVKGGSRSPSPSTGLILFPQCGEDRNAFSLVGGAPVNLEKKVKGSPPIITNHNEMPRNVAVSILITKDPGLKNGFLDSAAALAQSVLEAKSEFKLDLLAILSPEVKIVRPALRRIGYRIVEKPLPVELSEIKNKQLVKELEVDGCCGPWEYLKLWAWTLDEYDRVLQVDADVHFHRNFDDLFRYNTTLLWTHGALGGSEVMNGGFLVVRPNRAHFDGMVKIIKSGDWRSGKGWLGKCCWTYGGRTIQGIVPAYYLYHLESEHYEIQRCRYNNMVEIDRCKTWEFEEVKSNHFTVCQKPWFCIGGRHPLCNAFQKSWQERIERVKKKLDFSAGGTCSGSYRAIDWSIVNNEQVIYENQIVTR